MPALEYSEWIDTITLILTVAGLILGFIYSQVLQNADDRRELIAALRDGKVRRLYQGGVNWLLRGLQRFYGGKDSLQAFSMSLLLSYFYPFLFFILTYGYFQGENSFAGVTLFPEDSLLRPFSLFIAIFLCFVFLIYFLIQSGGVILERLGLMSRSERRSWQPISSLILMVFLILSIKYEYSVAAYLGYFYMSIFFGLLVVAFFQSERLFFKTVFLLTPWIMSVWHFWSGARGTSLMFAFFYVLLPLVNALLDWLSWWVSRFFLERTAQAPRVRVIVLDVVLDFGVAVLFMLALCLLLPAGAILLDSLYAGWVNVKTGVPAQTGWQEYAVLARDDPWGKGIMVTLMLVTTLIPTLLHILLGLMAFFIHGFKGAALADFLEKPRKNWRDAVASFWMFGYVVLAGAALWAMYQVFQHFAQLPIAHWLYNFTGYFYDLP